MGRAGLSVHTAGHAVIAVLLCACVGVEAQNSSAEIGEKGVRFVGEFRSNLHRLALSEFCGHSGADECRPVTSGEFFVAVGKWGWARGWCTTAAQASASMIILLTMSC